MKLQVRPSYEAPCQTKPYFTRPLLTRVLASLSSCSQVVGGCRPALESRSLHLPAALVLGARDSLTRRLSATLTVFGLAIPMAMITIALTCWSTIDGFTSDPGRIGLAAPVTVSQGGLDSKQLQALISQDDQVRAAYPGAQFVTLLPGDNGTFIARAMGTSSRPYPFRVVQGRMFHAPTRPWPARASST